MDNLRQLMSAYFHQDWSEEYHGSWWEAVDDFIQREPARVAGARAEIEGVLASADDSAVAQALESSGGYFWPGEACDAHRRWLESVAARLDTAVAP